jgi:hypothetical protein
MTDPWTGPDPQPGDFDAELATIDPCYVEALHGGPDATLEVLVKRPSDDVARDTSWEAMRQRLGARRTPRSARSSPATTARFIRPTARGRPPRCALLSASLARFG